MAELIDRQAVLREMLDPKYTWEDYDEMENLLGYIPAVDAVEDRFATAFGEIAAYNCHEEWLWELADKLSELEAGKYFCCPITTEEWLTDRHALWMMLASAYGNWGTSIRHGWIEKTAEAASFINEATERYAEWREENAAD